MGQFHRESQVCRGPRPLWGGAPRPWSAASWHGLATQNFWQSQSQAGRGERTFLGTRIPQSLCCSAGGPWPLLLRQPGAVASASLVWVPACSSRSPLTLPSPHSACSFPLPRLLCLSSRWLLAF